MIAAIYNIVDNGRPHGGQTPRNGCRDDCTFGTIKDFGIVKRPACESVSWAEIVSNPTQTSTKGTAKKMPGVLDILKKSVRQYLEKVLVTDSRECSHGLIFSTPDISCTLLFVIRARFDIVTSLDPDWLAVRLAKLFLPKLTISP